MADDVQVRFGASIGELISGVDQVKEAILSIAEPVNKVKEAFLGVGEGFAAAFGVERVVAFYESMAELGEQTERSMAILGQTSKQVGELDFMAKSTGTSAEGLTRAMERFALSLQHGKDGSNDTAKGLEALGLRAKDLIGLPIDTVLGRIADKVSQFGDGMNKAAIMAALFGSRLGGSLIPLFNEGAQGLEALRQKADDTGTVMDEHTVKAFADLEKQIVTAKSALEGLGIAIAAMNAGAIGSLVQWLTDVAEKMRLLVASGQFWKAEVDGLKTALDSWSASLYNAGRIMGDFLKFDFAKVVSDWEEGTKVQERILEEHLRRVGIMMLTAKFKQQADLAKVPEGNKPGAPELPGIDKAGAEAAREQIKQAQEIYQITADRLNSEVKLNEITEDQKSAALQTALNRRTLAESAAYDELSRLYAGDAAGYAKIQAEKLQMLTQGVRESLKTQQQQLETDKQAWQNQLAPIQSAWDSQLRGLLSGTESWGQAMKNIFADLVIVAIQAIEKIIVEKAALALADSVGGPPNAKAIAGDVGQAYAGFAAYFAPTLGPGALPAAAALAGSVGLAASAFSAPSLDIGGYVHSDGIAMIHAGETVVPASVSSPYEGSGGGGRGGAVHIHINALDGASVNSWVNNNKDTISRVVWNHMGMNPGKFG